MREACWRAPRAHRAPSVSARAGRERHRLCARQRGAHPAGREVPVLHPGSLDAEVDPGSATATEVENTGSKRPLGGQRGSRGMMPSRYRWRAARSPPRPSRRFRSVGCRPRDDNRSRVACTPRARPRSGRHRSGRLCRRVARPSPRMRHPDRTLPPRGAPVKPRPVKHRQQVDDHALLQLCRRAYPYL
jgi:hypothetical protein